MAALEHGSAFFASLKEKKKKLCIAFAAINARIKHMQTLGSDAVLGWRIDIFCPPGRTILPTFFFFFSVVYRLVGCDSSFCLCRVFFCFSFVFSLSAALFVYKVSCMCVRVCCRVFCEKCFWVLSVWMPCNFFRAVDDSSRCWSPLSERVPIELRPVGSANWCWIHLFFPPVCANC